MHLVFLQITNERFSAGQNGSVVVDFNIEPGMGLNTTVSVISKTTCDIEISVTGPNSFTQSKSGNQTKSLSHVVTGISEVRLRVAFDFIVLCQCMI